MEKKENQPVRVLQVLGGTSLGGAESRVMDLYRNIDRTRVQFDFAVHTARKGFFDDEIRALGGEIYSFPRFRGYNWIAYRKAWRRFFEEHPEYVCVHGHMTSTASLYLAEAGRAGIGCTAAHARSAGTDSGIKGWMTRVLRKNLAGRAEVCLACSELAGRAVFGEKAWRDGLVHVVPNAIEVAKYVYDPEKRERLRCELGISDRFVIGHVGRFNPVKNHPFLLDVFYEIKKQREDAVLLLVGEGGGMEAAKEKAAALGLEKSVLFAGSRPDAADFYQAMDFMVFPSLYEGLPGTILEAQAAGLPCLMSDTITREVMLTGLVEAMSLERPAEEWAGRVIAAAQENAGGRRSYLEELRAAGFDVKKQARQWEIFYKTGEGAGLWKENREKTD